MTPEGITPHASYALCDGSCHKSKKSSLSVALFVTGNTSFEYEVCIYLYLYKVHASTGLSDSVTWSLER